MTPYAHNGAGDGNGCQASAISESIVPYACNGVGDGNRGQAAAIRESPIPYNRNGIVFSFMRYLFGDDGGFDVTACTANLRCSIFVKFVFHII